LRPLSQLPLQEGGGALQTRLVDAVAEAGAVQGHDLLPLINLCRLAFAFSLDDDDALAELVCRLPVSRRGSTNLSKWTLYTTEVESTL
jgi:hypothetical protein